MTTLHRALAVVMLLSACTPSDGRFNPSRFALAGAGAPPDVVLPAGTKPGSTYGGIKTLAPSEDGFCCAAGSHLDLPVGKRRPATALILGIYVQPTIGRETLRITFPDGAVKIANVTTDQFSTTRVAIPKALRSAIGTIRIRVDADRAPYTLASIYFE